MTTAPDTVTPSANQPDRRSRARLWVRRLGRILIWLAVAVVSLWAFGALWYFGAWPAWIRVTAAVLFLVYIAIALVRLPQRRSRKVVALGVLLVWLLWFLRTPSNDLVWTSDQARTPMATFEENMVAIENVRFATYRDVDDYDIRWETRHFDLDTVRTVDFVVEPFASWRGPAHTFLTFGFDDGRHLAISVEIRKEEGESFSALGALFRQYEIMYVVGDERDLIGLRTNVRQNPVYLFPVRGRHEQFRELLVSMLQRANQLHEQPEFYNTLVNTCTTNIVRHLEEVAERKVPLDRRVMLPGYADELAFELDLVDFEGTVDEARQRFLIAKPVPVAADGPAWSRKIREQKRESPAKE